MTGRDYDDDEPLSADPWDAASRDVQSDDLDDLTHSTFAGRDLEDVSHSTFAPRDIEGDDDEGESLPREMPRSNGRSTDAGLARLAATEMREALKEIPRGRAPELRALPRAHRDRGVCALFVVMCDGRKVIYR